MADIPEPSKEVQPIFRDSKKEPRLPYPDKVVVPELPDSIKPKVSMPAKSSIAWDAIRHFLYGGIAGGSAAWAAIAGVLKLLGLTGPAAVGASLAPPFGYLIGAVAIIIGLCDAGRKVVKEKSGGKDWTDVLYQVLQLILKAFQTKGGAK